MKNKVFDNYDYESCYDKVFDELTGEFLNSVIKPPSGIAYTTATIKAGNQLEVEIYPSFKKDIPEMIRRYKQKKRSGTRSEERRVGKECRCRW